MRSLIFAMLLLPASLAAWDPHLDVIGRWGNYRDGAGAVLFAPLSQNGNSLFFGQALGGWFRDQWSGSLGIGYRTTTNREIAIGTNLFYDIARSTHNRIYNQLGVGLELFGNCWDGRVNGYFPTRNQFRREEVRARAIGVRIFEERVTTREQGYLGFDCEGGYGYPLWCGQVWAHAGYFYYDREEVKAIQGPRLRGDYRLADLFTPGSEIVVGVEWEWNRRHGSTVSGTASLRYPLSRCPRTLWNSCCSSLCRQMGDPVIRNRTIWVDNQIDRVFIPTGDLLFFVANVYPTEGSGTQTDPMNIEQADGITSPNAIFFGLQDDGDIDVTPLAAPWTLSMSQRVFGFGNGSTATVEGVVIVDRTGSGRAIFQGANALTTIQAADMTEIQGVAVSGSMNTAAKGILLNTTGSLVVRDVIASDCSMSGLELDIAPGVPAVTAVEVRDSTFTRNADGVLSSIAGPGNMSVLVENCQFINNINNSIVGTTALAGGTFDLTIEQSTFVGGLFGITVLPAGEGASNIQIRGNRLDAINSGILLGEEGIGHSSIVEISWNRIGESFALTRGIEILLSSADATLYTASITIENNPIIRTTDRSIRVANDWGIAGHLAELLIRDNPLIDSGSSPAFDLTGQTLASTSVILLGNNQVNSVPNGSNPGYTFTTSALSTGTLCVTMGTTPTDIANANNTNNGGKVNGIEISEIAGTITVNGTNATSLSDINNSIGVDDSGGAPTYAGVGFSCFTP